MGVVHSGKGMQDGGVRVRFAGWRAALHEPSGVRQVALTGRTARWLVGVRRGQADRQTRGVGRAGGQRRWSVGWWWLVVDGYGVESFELEDWSIRGGPMGCFGVIALWSSREAAQVALICFACLLACLNLRSWVRSF
jgi:hypothetical protein